MMQKEVYQGYDFISNELANSNQYFLVEDNKAYLINKITNRATGEVQYVTENVKEQLESLQVQTCPVYDVSQEQYYINDGTELIVTEALNIPEDQASDVIANSILVQAVPETSTNEVQQQVLPEQQIIENNVPLEATAGSEITLSYEQCKILEEKGWLLLETNDNVYVLNASGLHNITNDKELLQKCRTIISESETNNVTTHQELAQVKEDIHYAREEHVAEETIVQTTEESVAATTVGDISSHIVAIDNNITIPTTIEANVAESTTKIDTNLIEYALPIPSVDISSHIVAIDNNITIPTTIEANVAESTTKIDTSLIEYLPIPSVDINTTMIAADEPVFQMETQDALGGIQQSCTDVNQGNAPTPVVEQVKTVPKIEMRKPYIPGHKTINATKKVVKLKLKTHMKEIPKQIFLCVLKNGKKLYARKKMSPKKKRPYNAPLTMVVGQKGIDKKKDKKKSKSGQEQFRDEVEAAMNNACSLSQWPCTDEALGAAETIITQLLSMDHIEEMMTGKNIILTKVQRKETRVRDRFEMKSELKSVVTGRIAQFDDSVNTWKFIYVPDLIEKLKKMGTGCDEYEMSVTGDPLPCERDKSLDDDCIHIHVSETVRDNTAPQTILTLAQRHLPWMPNNRKKTVLVCSACASRFDTLPELMEHQNQVCNHEKDLLDIEEGKLQIDTSQRAKSPVYFMFAGTNGDRKYKCRQCQNSFKKITNYERHKKSHGEDHGEQNTAKETSQDEQPEARYKCNMCAALYNRSPTLIRHIVTQHISKPV